MEICFSGEVAEAVVSVILLAGAAFICSLNFIDRESLSMMTLWWHHWCEWIDSP